MFTSSAKKPGIASPSFVAGKLLWNSLLACVLRFVQLFKIVFQSLSLSFSSSIICARLSFTADISSSSVPLSSIVLPRKPCVPLFCFFTFSTYPVVSVSLHFLFYLSSQPIAQLVDLCLPFYSPSASTLVIQLQHLSTLTSSLWPCSASLIISLFLHHSPLINIHFFFHQRHDVFPHGFFVFFADIWLFQFVCVLDISYWHFFLTAFRLNIIDAGTNLGAARQHI